MNRGELNPWNKGKKLTLDQKAKQNIAGLKKGQGWNKGIPNNAQSLRWKQNNPNANGRLNNLRPKKTVTDEFQKYKSEVRKATYRSIKELKQKGHFIPKFGKYKNNLQIDHIVSIKQGFELGISSSLLGSLKNIQFLTAEDNRAKWHYYQPKSVVRILQGSLYGL